MERWALWLGGLSIVSLAASVVLVPYYIGRLPADYFARKERDRRTGAPDGGGASSKLALIGKNVLGWIFILAGILMLALPGQGVLTILIGLTLIDFPGKFALERKLVSRRPVLRALNWIRKKRGREPLRVA